MRITESGAAPHVALPKPAPAPAGLSARQTLLFAAAVAFMVMNLFAVQTIGPDIAHTLGLGETAMGIIAMLPQLGYATGLVLLVPLSDKLENRRLIVGTALACAVFMLAAAWSPAWPVFMASVFAAGVASCAIQMLVPMAAFMSPEARRGATVGNVMSGLLVGILLSRPVAGLVTQAWGWRALYLMFALGVAVVALVLSRTLPRRYVEAGQPYPALIASMAQLLRSEPVLRWRAATAALSMAAYSVFWTAAVLELASPPFTLGALGIALFTLCAVTGAVVAPAAGRAGDRGYTRKATIVAHAVITLSWVAAGVGGAGWLGLSPQAHPIAALAMLAVAAVALDAGVIGEQTLGRRGINLVRPQARGRMNGLFVGIFFIGGSIGSALAGAAWSWMGWNGVCAAGLAVSAVLMVFYWAAPRSL
jgi:predicted MFS family arabinose efflux permease